MATGLKFLTDAGALSHCSSKGNSARSKPLPGPVRCPSCKAVKASDHIGTRNKRRSAVSARISPPSVNKEPSARDAPFVPPIGWPFRNDSFPLELLVDQDSHSRPPLVSDETCSSSCAEVVDDNVTTGFRWEGSAGFSEQSHMPVMATGPPKQKQESSHGDNYYANVGMAIRTLREDLPCMFYKKPNFDIFRQDVVFRDPINTFYGLKNYQLIFWALRFHGRIFFKAIWVDVHRIWQPNDRTIMIRWTVRGMPRVFWEAQGHFDGTSEYKLDKEGKIFEHKVDNVALSRPDGRVFQPLTVADLVRVAGGKSTPTLTFFERVFLLYIGRVSWVRFYWALRGTLALNGAA